MSAKPELAWKSHQKEPLRKSLLRRLFSNHHQPPQQGSQSADPCKPAVFYVHLDLSHLSEDEQKHIRAVLERLHKSEQKIQQHQHGLKEEWATLKKRTRLPLALAIRATCHICFASAVNDKLHQIEKCEACHQFVCAFCSIKNTLQGCEVVKKFCRICWLERQIKLTGDRWRTRKWSIFNDRPQSHALIEGYGVALACGLLSGSGIHRTFVIESTTGGPADVVGLCPGDEILYWGPHPLVRQTFYRVYDIIQRYEGTEVRLKVRRYASHREPLTVDLVLTRSKGGRLSTAQLQRMLASPDMIGFGGGFLESDQGKPGMPALVFPYGRVKLRLKLRETNLNVTVKEAEQLPPLKPGVPPTAFVEVNINLPGTESSPFLSPPATQTCCPCWKNAAVSFSDVEVKHSTLEVKVYSRKSFGSKLLLCQVDIPLSEALLNDSSQWYILQPCDPSMPRFPLAPTESTLREMRCRHVERPGVRYVSSRKPSAHPLGLSPLIQPLAVVDDNYLARSWDRAGATKKWRACLGQLREDNLISMASNPELSAPGISTPKDNRRRSLWRLTVETSLENSSSPSSAALNRDSLASRSVPTDIHLLSEVTEEEEDEETNVENNSIHRLFGRESSLQEAQADDVTLHKVISRTPTVESAKRFSFLADGETPCVEATPKEPPPKEQKKSLWRKKKSSLDVDNCVKEHKLRQLREEVKRRSLMNPEDFVPDQVPTRPRKIGIGNGHLSLPSLAPRSSTSNPDAENLSEQSCAGAGTESTVEQTPEFSPLSKKRVNEGKSTPECVTLEGRVRRPPAVEETMSGARSMDSIPSIASSAGSTSLDDASLLNEPGEHTDARLLLSFLWANSQLYVDIEEVNNLLAMVSDKELSSSSDIFLKVSLHSVTGRREFKTDRQPPSTRVMFCHMYSFPCTVPEAYTLKARVFLEKKGKRLHMRKRKMLCYVVLPLLDLSLQPNTRLKESSVLMIKKD